MVATWQRSVRREGKEEGEEGERKGRGREGGEAIGEERSRLWCTYEAREGKREEGRKAE